MSEQQEESEDRSYIQKGDIVFVSQDNGNSDLCRVVSKSFKNADILFLQSLRCESNTYEQHIRCVSLLIPKESLSFQSKMEDDRFMVYNDGQLVMNIPCPSYTAYRHTAYYIRQMMHIYALKQLAKTCKDEKILKLLNTVKYIYD